MKVMRRSVSLQAEAMVKGCGPSAASAVANANCPAWCPGQPLGRSIAASITCTPGVAMQLGDAARHPPRRPHPSEQNDDRGIGAVAEQHRHHEPQRRGPAAEAHEHDGVEHQDQVDRGEQAVGLVEQPVGDALDQRHGDEQHRRVERPLAQALRRLAQAAQGLRNRVLRPAAGARASAAPASPGRPPTSAPWPTASGRSARTRAPIPSHLCSRYILSSPPSRRSGQRGRSARIMARLMQPMASTPVAWTMEPRSGKNPRAANTCGSAASHSAARSASAAQKASLMVRMPLVPRPTCSSATSRYCAGAGCASMSGRDRRRLRRGPAAAA